MKNILIVLHFFFAMPLLVGQSYVYVHQDADNAKETVHISDEVTFPDLKVQLGRDVPFRDIRVGITPYKSQANYIITKDESDAGLSVKVDNCDNFPDLSILVGEDVSFPDYRIEFRDRSSLVDVLIYTEKVTISEQELIACLLPLIREKAGE